MNPPKSPNGIDTQFQWPVFSSWYPFGAGVLVGLLLRFVFFGAPGTGTSAMAGAFIFYGPLAIGAITVYVAERTERRSWGYYFWAPVVATTACVLGSLLILIEGLVCAVLIVPMFALAGAVGGLLMGTICRVTHWPRHAAYAFVALPLVMAMVLPPNTDQRIESVERSLRIEASAQQVWDQLMDARDIASEEVGRAWIARIGVPQPVSGITVRTPQGWLRKSTWAKGVKFDELIHEFEPARHVRWTYRFAPDSFPVGALDDHVRIGGSYFDLVETSYTLTPETGGTRLHIRTVYRLSTDFDAYANWLAQRLLGNFSEVILDMYKARSERAANAAA